MKLRFAMIGVLALASAGCATITRGTTQAWSVDSDPIGANVELSSGEHCKTPCTLTKKRKEPFMVTVSKDGYEPVQTQVQSQVAGAGAAGMAGNVLVGGLIGIGVDAASGATKELTPNPLVLKLVKTSVTPHVEPAPGPETSPAPTQQ